MTRIREAAAVAWGDREPVGCALAARITATFPRPKSGVNKTALYHTSKPDADNVLKAILDSITPVEVKGFVVSRGVMLDDKQACFVECHKRWADVGAQGDILAEFWWLDAH
jgi:Holliday junction resolvase RusA-like endonuclease